MCRNIPLEPAAGRAGHTGQVLAGQVLAMGGSGCGHCEHFGSTFVLTSILSPQKPLCQSLPNPKLIQMQSRTCQWLPGEWATLSHIARSSASPAETQPGISMARKSQADCSAEHAFERYQPTRNRAGAKLSLTLPLAPREPTFRLSWIEASTHMGRCVFFCGGGGTK